MSLGVAEEGGKEERWQEWKRGFPWKTSRRKWLTLQRKETGTSFIVLEISFWPWYVAPLPNPNYNLEKVYHIDHIPFSNIYALFCFVSGFFCSPIRACNKVTSPISFYKKLCVSGLSMCKSCLILCIFMLYITIYLWLSILFFGQVL